eukprot:Rmarinus@m.13813
MWIFLTLLLAFSTAWAENCSSVHIKTPAPGDLVWKYVDFALEGLGTASVSLVIGSSIKRHLGVVQIPFQFRFGIGSLLPGEEVEITATAHSDFDVDTCAHSSDTVVVSVAGNLLEQKVMFPPKISTSGFFVNPDESIAVFYFDVRGFSAISISEANSYTDGSLCMILKDQTPTHDTCVPIPQIFPFDLPARKIPAGVEMFDVYFNVKPHAKDLWEDSGATWQARDDATWTDSRHYDRFARCGDTESGVCDGETSEANVQKPVPNFVGDRFVYGTTVAVDRASPDYWRERCISNGYPATSACLSTLSSGWTTEGGLIRPSDFGWFEVNCTSIRAKSFSHQHRAPEVSEDIGLQETTMRCPLQRPVVIFDHGDTTGAALLEALRVYSVEHSCPSLLVPPTVEWKWAIDLSASVIFPTSIVDDDVESICPEAMKMAGSGRLTWKSVETLDRVWGDGTTSCMAYLRDPRTFLATTMPSWQSMDEILDWKSPRKNGLARRLLGDIDVDPSVDALPLLRERVRRCAVGTLEDFSMTWRLWLKIIPGLSEKAFVERFVTNAPVLRPGIDNYYVSRHLMEIYNDVDTPLYNYARGVLVEKVADVARPRFNILEWSVPSPHVDIPVLATPERSLVLEKNLMDMRRKPGLGSSRYIGVEPCDGEFFHSPAYAGGRYICGKINTHTPNSCCCILREPNTTLANSFGQEEQSTYDHSQPEESTPMFCLPSFVIIGAQKAGTSVLAFTISELLEPGMKLKECQGVTNSNYHDTLYSFSLCSEWFPFSLIHKVSYFDVAPRYSRHPMLVSRFAAYFATSPVVYVVRNPIERAISSYKMDVTSFGAAALPDINDIFLAELNALKRCLGDYPGMPEFVACHEVSAQASRGRMYLYGSLYSRHLALWTHFTRSVLVVPFEKVVGSPDDLKNLILSIGQYANIHLTKFPEPLSEERMRYWTEYFNMPKYWHSPRQEVHVHPATYAALQKFFRPFNEELQSLVSFPIDWDE